MNLRSKFLVLFAIVSCFSSLYCQNIVSGTVSSSDDSQGLIGVSILSLPSMHGTLSDIDGNFTIDIKEDDTLQFSYIGYETVKLYTQANSALTVVMSPDMQIVDEIVIVGYGKTKKSDLTGSVSSVKSEELLKVPSSNPLQALQGKVSGMSVLTTSGDPGANPVVRLRGITTLNNNNPVVVIDGIITDVGAMSSLNSHDITSLEVLKDASSTAIYGARGAAGVIIITTKQGTSKKNKITFSLDQSIESVAKKLDVMNAVEFAEYVNVISPGTFNNVGALADTDWQDLVFQDNAAITNANFSASGATETASYYLGLGYFGHEGIIPKSRLDRLTLKLNSAYDLNKNLSIGLNLSLAGNGKDNAPGVVNTSLRAWPVDAPFNEDGSFAEVNGGNPLAAIEYSNSRTSRLRGLGNIYAELGFLKHFTIKTSGQVDFASYKSKSFVPVYFVAPLQQNERNDLSVGYGNSQTLIWENILNYSQDFGQHSISALAGYTAQSTEDEFLGGTAENLIREDPSFWYIDAGEDEFERSSNLASKNTILSYLARVNYSYDSRYLFTGTFRRDGSSKFGVTNRYANFPSVAFGWNISNESFFPQNSILNNLKLRTSWGIIGNERIPGNAQYSLISPGSNAVFGLDENIFPGATFSSGGNPSLKWEETRQTDVGVEAGFLENKLLVELDYYNKMTSDILVNLEPIGYTGIGAFQSIFFNAADVSNSGFEWNVSYRDNVNKHTDYQISFLGSTVRNEVLDIGQGLGADSLLVGGNLGNGQQVSRSSVGQPIGYFFGYEVEGIFQNQAELESSAVLFGQKIGDLKYKDINGDGVINGKDRTFIGSSIPKLIYGFNAKLGYKNLEFSADIQGQYGNKIYNGKQAIRFALLNYEDKYNDYWSGEGSTNENFRPSQGGNNFVPSSYFVEDGSFLRIRNVTVSYDFGSRALSRLKLSSCRAYVRAVNLYTLTRFTGYSPDLGASNATSGVIDVGGYPITRVISVGLTVGI